MTFYVFKATLPTFWYIDSQSQYCEKENIWDAIFHQHRLMPCSQ